MDLFILKKKQPQNNNSIIYFRIKVVMNRFKITLGNKGYTLGLL